MRSIAETLGLVPTVLIEIEGLDAELLSTLEGELDPLPELTDRITREIVDEAPLSTGAGGMFRDGIHAELDELRDAARSGKSWMAELEARERQRTGIAKLKIGFNKVFGYYIEVSRAQAEEMPR